MKDPYPVPDELYKEQATLEEVFWKDPCRATAIPSIRIKIKILETKYPLEERNVPTPEMGFRIGKFYSGS